MVFLITLSILSLLFHSLHLPGLWMQIATNAQVLCIQKVPSADFHDFIASLVCGKDLSNSTQLSVLLSTQLYHLAVVSGGHLQILLELLEIFVAKTTFGGLIITALLILFSTFTGLQAPVTRSLFVFLFNRFHLKLKIKSRPDLVQLISGTLCLLLFPDWIYSYSLFLSWWAGLSLCLSSQLFPSSKKQNPYSWKKNLCRVGLVQISTGLALGIFSGIGIVANWLIAPTFSFLLFPIGLLSLMVPQFSIIFDFISTFFFFLLSSLNKLDDLTLSFEGLPKMGLTPWFCLALFTLLVRLIAIHQARKKCF